MFKARSSAALSLVMFFLTGCADGAKLIQESEQGGVVVYPFKGEQGSLLSPFRKEALELMKNKCGGKYHIVREGETKGRTRVAAHLEGGQEAVQERRWGIEFQCQ